MNELEEKIFWQKQEDMEQIHYLKWQQERRSFKNALVNDSRMREEYRLARRMCQGYTGKDFSGMELIDALEAAFILDRCSVVKEAKILKEMMTYLPPKTYRALSAWRTERDLFTKKTIDFNKKVSPLTIARIFAGMQARNSNGLGYDGPVINVSPMDLAIFFMNLSNDSDWNPASKRQFQKLAIEWAEKYVVQNSEKTTQQSLLWKEMHDIIVKEHPTKQDHLRFELIGLVGQRLGIDLEDDLLRARQHYLKNKPEEQSILAGLQKVQRRRHSLLGHLGLVKIKRTR